MPGKKSLFQLQGVIQDSLSEFKIHYWYIQNGTYINHSSFNTYTWSQHVNQYHTHLKIYFSFKIKKISKSKVIYLNQLHKANVAVINYTDYSDSSVVIYYSTIYIWQQVLMVPIFCSDLRLCLQLWFLHDSITF